jgi:arginine deiminase
MKLSVNSETERLKGVIVHTPGREVSLVNPDLKDELLFDDIIFEEDARQEHLGMLQIFKTVMPTDGKVFEITDLFRECLQNEGAQTFFIDLLVNKLQDENLDFIKNELTALPADGLLQFVIEGTTPQIPHFSLSPSPNLIFTRDLAAVAGENLILSQPAHKARLREALLMETLVNYHPLFFSVRKNIIKAGSGNSIEGGDVVIASGKVVLIGMSERTSVSALMAVAEGLLSGRFEYVVAVDIPKQRSSMHLDTIFTFAGEDECIVFPPAILKQTGNISVLTCPNGSIQSTPGESLKSTLEELLGRNITFIKCGGENPMTQYREQWTDGANVLALAPGIIVGYGRNTNTFKTLEEHGYRHMTQQQFLEEYKQKPFVPSKQKIAISFAGHELCRGRGGARCMTMPVLRESS